MRDRRVRQQHELFDKSVTLEPFTLVNRRDVAVFPDPHMHFRNVEIQRARVDSPLRQSLR